MERLLAAIVVLASASAHGQTLDRRISETATKDSVAGRRAAVELIRTELRSLNQPRVIFGTDDRVEREAISDPMLDLLADSACLLVDISELIDNTDGTYTLITTDWTEVAAVPLCPAERFAGQPQLGFCSGFLAGADLIATSGACMTPSDLATTAFVFGYQLSSGVTPTVIDADDVYFAQAIVDTELAGPYDHTVVQLDRPVVGRNPAPIARTTPTPGTPLAIVGHTSFLPLKSSDGATAQSIDAPDTFLQANLDAYAGDTGGMVVDTSAHRVVGVFARGAPDFDLTGPCAQSNSVPDTGNPGPGLAFEEVSLTTRFESFIPALGLLAYPGADTLHFGAVAGPFTNASITYTISNPSVSPIDYTVSLDDPSSLLLLNGAATPINATVAPGATATFTIDLAPGVNALGAAVLTADVVIDDTTNAVQIRRTHTVEIGQTLVSLSPNDEFSTAGPVGGPFPGAIDYTVTSERPTPVTVEVTATEPWVEIDGGASATLNLSGVGDNDQVSITIGSGANALAPGLYTADVVFHDLSSGDMQTRSVSLDVGPIVYTGAPLAVPDYTAVRSTITIPDAVCIADLDVDLDLTHTFPGDLRVTLSGPNETEVVLRAFGSGAPAGFTRYDDEGTAPEGPGLLSDFDATLAAGEWSLAIEDLSTGDAGSVDAWSLRIVPASPCGAVAHDAEIAIESNRFVPIDLNATSATGLPIAYTIESMPTDGRLFDDNGDAVLATPYTLPAGTSRVWFRAKLDFIGDNTFTFSADDSIASNSAQVTLHIGHDLPITSFDLDTDPVWAQDGAWDFGLPQGMEGDPASAFSGTNALGYNLAGAYAPDIPAPEFLTTSPINLTGITSTQLRFRRWLGVEDATWDHADIETSPDGSDWTNAWSNPTGVGQAIFETGWSEQVIDIGALDNEPAARIRWGLGPTDSVSNFHGWNLDDIEIIGTPPLRAVADLTTTNAPIGDPLFGVPDGSVTAIDIQFFVTLWIGQEARADLTTPNAPVGDPLFGMPDGQVTAIDLSLYVNEWIQSQ